LAKAIIGRENSSLSFNSHLALFFLAISFPPLEDLVHLAIIDSENTTVPLLHALVITDDQHYSYYAKASAMNLLARKRCEETIEPDPPESSSPRTSPTVPLRIFRMDFHPNISKYEAQGILNGWTHESSGQYPPYSESRLFCDWASELRTLFPHLIHNQFVCSQNFEKWVEPLTGVQRIMAFNKAMVNHKLQEVKYLFVRSIPFYYSTFFETNKYSLTRNLGCWYTWIIFPVAEGIRTRASFILQRWRRRVLAGFSNHHSWVAGEDNSLVYIPKCRCKRHYPFQNRSTYIFGWFYFIVDLLTPEAAMNAITRGFDHRKEIRERSDLPPLPDAF
jgi:hypothetical protein